MIDVRAKRWIAGVLLVAGAAAALLWFWPAGSTDKATAGNSEPARVEPIKGTDLSRVVLSAQAARRLGIRTGSVARHGAKGEVIPYDAVLYDPEGRTFTYTSPQPLVFVRHAIAVERVVGHRAFLSSGPPAGTAVVTVGAQELFGVEYDVEED